MFEGNNGYFPICKTCVKNYFDYLVDYFSGNEEKALDRMCSIMDLYYCDDAAVASKSVATSSSRIASYISRTQMQQNAKLGTTYLDTIKDRSSNTIDSAEDLEEARGTGEKGVTAAAISRWGLGYNGDEYIFLDGHYKTLKSQISEEDPIQEIYIKDMCVNKIMQSRAMKSGEAEKMLKLQEGYRKAAKDAGIKVRSGDMDSLSDDACWGNFVRDIETFVPAEIYTNKKLFDDVDRIKEYFERFIVRPFKNFFGGTNEQDSEFSINVGDDSDGQ